MEIIIKLFESKFKSQDLRNPDPENLNYTQPQLGLFKSIPTAKTVVLVITAP